MPVRVTISDGNGNVLDGFEINSTNSIRYGNEKIATMESGPLGGLSYTSGQLLFDSPMEVRNNLKGYEGQRFVRRKAVLMQLSKVIDEMEERLFFLETKHDIEIYVGKGKHDYTPLETAQAEALEAFKTGNFDALEGPMAVWTEWSTKTDFTNKKAMVTKKVATGLSLNLAVCHLYRDEYVECAQAISTARGLAVGDAGTLAKCDELLDRLMKRRRSSVANPDFVMPSKEEVEREKAPDFKSAVGKRSQNKDVAMILPGDRYLEMGDMLAKWQSEFVAGSAEAAASEAAEMTMEQRLGAKLTTTIGGVSLSLNPLTDPDLVGHPLPVEVLSIPKLVYLDLSGMKMGSLPANIDELSMLQTLVVSGNELNELPAALANIPTLKRVVARNNNLTSLPAGMELIPELKVIDLKGNPFDDSARCRPFAGLARTPKSSSTDGQTLHLCVAYARGRDCACANDRKPGFARAARSCMTAIKVNLTDFISGKYSLSYERVIGPWTTAEFTVTSIGMTTSDYTYTIAQACTTPTPASTPACLRT